jgi:hypothetical protein
MKEGIKLFLSKSKTAITTNSIGFLKVIICTQIILLNVFLATLILIELTPSITLLILLPFVVTLVYGVFTMLSLLCVHFIAEAQLK